MALFLFTDAILNNRPINVYNYGDMKRDFTYIDDIVAGTIAALERPVPYEVFNLGNSKTEQLMKLIQILEEELGQGREKYDANAARGCQADVCRYTEIQRSAWV